MYICQSQSCNSSHPLPLWHPHVCCLPLQADSSCIAAPDILTSSSSGPLPLFWPVTMQPRALRALWPAPRGTVLRASSCPCPVFPAQLVLPHEKFHGPPGAHTCPAQSVGVLTPVGKIKPTGHTRQRIESPFLRAHTRTRAQSCPALYDPVDCSPPGSSVHRILQARILEWVAISYSRGCSWPRDQTRVSWVSCFGQRVLLPLHHLGSPSHALFWSSGPGTSTFTAWGNMAPQDKHSLCGGWWPIHPGGLSILAHLTPLSCFPGNTVPNESVTY